MAMLLRERVDFGKVPLVLEVPYLVEFQKRSFERFLQKDETPEGIKVRVVNVVDLMTLMYPDKHPHGMDDMSFNALFTESAPVIFAFHNNRWLIHTLVHGRSNEGRFHVHGYMDRGTTTTPFDMVVLNEMSRFHLALDALKHIPRLRLQAEHAITFFNQELQRHHDYIREHLEDMPEIRNWQWTKDFSDATAPAPLAKGHPQKAMFTDS